MFDELFNPSPSVDPPAPEVIALIVKVVALEPADSTGSPSSTTFDQDAPSASNSQTTPKIQSLVISNDVEEENHDLDVAHMNNDPFFGIPIPEHDSKASSSSDVIPTIVHTATPYSEHVNKWTKDHPLENIIGELQRPNYKDALTQACWIEAMKEKLNEFERHEVWELEFRKNQGLLSVGCSGYRLKKTNPRGIFINQSKYALESLKKYGMESSDPVDTPMAKPTKKHLHAIKIIFKYLRGTVNRGLWYPKDSSIALTAYADADHAGCQDTRRSTSGSMQFLGDRLVSWSSKR
ncbi:hypothetical protein Tco_0781612 [Tanacetum coccineum]